MIGRDNAESEVDKIMQKMDVENTGFLDYSEFIIATMNRQQLLSKENLEATFAAFDTKGKGMISVADIQAIIGEQADQDGIWKELLAEVEAAGEIDTIEFKNIMTKMF